MRASELYEDEQLKPGSMVITKSSEFGPVTYWIKHYSGQWEKLDRVETNPRGQVFIYSSTGEFVSEEKLQNMPGAGLYYEATGEPDTLQELYVLPNGTELISPEHTYTKKGNKWYNEKGKELPTDAFIKALEEGILSVKR